MSDTIAAIATAPGRGGVGIVRVSGPQAKEICSALIGSVPTPRQACVSVFLQADKSQIDAGISLYFAAPKSFTGEDVVEFHGHGGPVILDLLLKRVLELGARLARPGEFTERAFLNNKMDLLQAEAVAQLINANSQQAALAATRSLQGEFSKKIYQLVEELIRLRLYVEAAIDFPEEEINFLADQKVLNAVENILSAFAQLLKQAKHGALLSEGINIAIIGKPNAGKSTLLNALTGQETAIVSPIAGTTRDTVKDRINLGGVTVNIIDTAGLRETQDIIEQAGITRTLRAAELADVILYVIDAETESDTDPFVMYPDLKQIMQPNAKVIALKNKIDQINLPPYVEQKTEYSVVAASAHHGHGLDLLRTEIKRLINFEQSEENGAFIARRRHLDALQRAQQFVRLGKQHLLETSAGELMAEELKHAQHALGEITGVFTSDDLLGRIFAEFCIGK